MKTLWLKLKGRSIELTHCANGSFHCLLTDVGGRMAEGWGDTEELARRHAMLAFAKSRRRAAFTAGLRGEGVK